MRRAILVLGMHRSGTSAVTRVLSLLGAALPKHVLNANVGNETGHWEPVKLIHIHDAMLAEAGSRWDDWRPFAIEKLSRSRAQFYRAGIARILDEEYGTAPLFVLKEPRTARFVPLYADILQSLKIDARYVLVSRNPLSVMASLAKRDGLSPAFSAVLWLRHELEAERATRGAQRVFLSYEEMMRDWRAGIDKVVRKLAVSWPRSPDEAAAEIEAFLSPAHQHHVASEAQLLADEGIVTWVKDAYTALRALEQDANDAQAMTTLDGVKAEFDASLPSLGKTLGAEFDARGRTSASALARVPRDLRGFFRRFARAGS